MLSSNNSEVTQQQDHKESLYNFDPSSIHMALYTTPEIKNPSHPQQPNLTKYENLAEIIISVKITIQSLNAKKIADSSAYRNTLYILKYFVTLLENNKFPQITEEALSVINVINESKKEMKNNAHVQYLHAQLYKVCACAAILCEKPDVSAANKYYNLALSLNIPEDPLDPISTLKDIKRYIGNEEKLLEVMARPKKFPRNSKEYINILKTLQSSSKEQIKNTVSYCFSIKQFTINKYDQEILNSILVEMNTVIDKYSEIRDKLITFKESATKSSATVESIASIQESIHGATEFVFHAKLFYAEILTQKTQLSRSTETAPLKKTAITYVDKLIAEIPALSFPEAFALGHFVKAMIYIESYKHTMDLNDKNAAKQSLRNGYNYNKNSYYFLLQTQHLELISLKKSDNLTIIEERNYYTDLFHILASIPRKNELCMDNCFTKDLLFSLIPEAFAQIQTIFLNIANTAMEIEDYEYAFELTSEIISCTRQLTNELRSLNITGDNSNAMRMHLADALMIRITAASLLDESTDDDLATIRNYGKQTINHLIHYADKFDIDLEFMNTEKQPELNPNPSVKTQKSTSTNNKSEIKTPEAPKDIKPPIKSKRQLNAEAAAEKIKSMANLKLLKADEHLRDAKTAQAKGNTSKAIAEYTAAFREWRAKSKNLTNELCIKIINASFELAACYSQTEEWDHALEAINRGIRLTEEADSTGIQDKLDILQLEKYKLENIIKQMKSWTEHTEQTQLSAKTAIQNSANETESISLQRQDPIPDSNTEPTVTTKDNPKDIEKTNIHPARQQNTLQQAQAKKEKKQQDEAKAKEEARVQKKIAQYNLARQQEQARQENAEKNKTQRAENKAKREAKIAEDALKAQRKIANAAFIKELEDKNKPKAAAPKNQPAVTSSSSRTDIVKQSEKKPLSINKGNTSKLFDKDSPKPSPEEVERYDELLELNLNEESQLIKNSLKPKPFKCASTFYRDSSVGSSANIWRFDIAEKYRESTQNLSNQDSTQSLKIAPQKR